MIDILKEGAEALAPLVVLLTLIFVAALIGWFVIPATAVVLGLATRR